MDPNRQGLLPCPFCGDRNPYLGITCAPESDHVVAVFAACQSCLAKIEVYLGKNYHMDADIVTQAHLDATMLWNSRVSPGEKELRAACDKAGRRIDRLRQKQGIEAFKRKSELEKWFRQQMTGG